LLNLEYCTGLFEASTIDRLIGYFRHVLGQLAKNPDRQLAGLEFLPDEERRQILFEFNDTVRKYPVAKTIHELFEEQVGKTPGNTALVYGENRLTYRELNRRSLSLAVFLRGKGVMPNTIVGIMVDRSLEMVVGMIGILAAGGAYLPVNHRQPANRKRYMLTDCGAELLLTGAGLTEGVDESIENIDLGEKGLYEAGANHVEKVSGFEDLAYVIYTSGSTGNPKGVPISHGNFCPLLIWGKSRLSPGSGDRVVQNLSYYFDWSVWEIFLALCSGSQLVMVAEEVVINPGEYIDFIDRNGITVLQITPSHFQTIAAQERRLESLRYLCIGAEKFTLDILVRSLELVREECRLFNIYGPTEATVIASVLEIDRLTAEGYTRLSSVPIGKPIANNNLWVLDKNLTLCPLNVRGELFIAGGGLAAGYLNDVEKTSRSFIKNVLKEVGGEGECLYRTGDLVRWLADGSLEFLGRIDHQVKIRGFRIELGEIEKQLLKQAEVKEAVVTASTNQQGEGFLCAYIVSRGEFNPPQLRDNLSRYLPDYMIPSYFVQLAEIPLNPNGKLDRSALPAPKIEKSEEYAAPENEVEKGLVKIWADLLGLEENSIGIHDNFFKLGGHSLNATVMTSRIKKEFHRPLPLMEIFKTPTIKQLARYLLAAEDHYSGIEKDENLVLLRRGNDSGKHFFMIHAGNGQVEGYIEFCNHLAPGFNYWGLRADPIENFTPRNITIEDVAGKYIKKIKTVQPSPPFYLGGWCIGGTIAFEMARQLEEMKKEVACLAIINSIAPDKLLKDHEIPFSLETESDWIPEDLKTDELKEHIERAGDSDRLWPLVVDYLEKNNYNAETIRGYIPQNYADATPNFGHQDIKGLVYYLNINRTFDHARRIYLPGGKCSAPVCFFGASLTEIFNREKWHSYCQEPLRYYHITGDHFSIFKAPEVAGFARTFNEVLADL
jgi:amino acid adenylation domain-containing protein